MNHHHPTIVRFALATVLFLPGGCRSAKSRRLNQDTEAILQMVSYDPTGGTASIKNASNIGEPPSRNISDGQDPTLEEKDSLTDRIFDGIADSLFDAAWSSVFGSSDNNRHVRERLRDGDENKARLRDDLAFARWLDERDQWQKED
ncbi:MAG: hypothetical protein AAF664_26260 [Planctomycetota bacterium]